MKTLAFTIAYKETFWLDMWLEHYSPSFSNLLVLDQGKNTITTQVDNLEVREFHPEFVGDWHNNIHEINKLRIEFAEEYEVTVFADCDEFLVPDPDYHESLKYYMERMDRNWVYVNGLDVIGLPYDPPIVWGFPLLSQREWVVANRMYQKPMMSKVAFPLSDGGHYHDGCKGQTSLNTDRTLWNFHMKMADWGEFKRRHAISHDPLEDHRLANMVRKNQNNWKPIPPRFFDCL